MAPRTESQSLYGNCRVPNFSIEKRKNEKDSALQRTVERMGYLGCDPMVVRYKGMNNIAVKLSLRPAVAKRTDHGSAIQDEVPLPDVATSTQTVLPP